MFFGILGTLRVEIEDGAGERVPVAIPGAKERLLLGRLLICPGRAVSVDLLLDDVWDGAPPPSARKSLQAHVVRLRSALEPGRPPGSPGRFIARRGDGYAITAGPAELDAARLTADAASGRAALASGDPATALAIVTAAELLWRGDPLADWPGSSWATAEQRRLIGVRRLVLETRFDAELASGRHHDVVPELESLVAHEPLHEAWWTRLMLALYRSDRQSDALDAARRARSTLGRELGLDAGPGLRRMEEAILRQDDALDLASARSVDGPGSIRVQAPAGLVSDECPFRGLAAYQPGDASVFHGRGAAVRGLVGRLRRAELVVISGPSGAGKSSLVRAGLVPALAAGALPGSENWRPVIISPGAAPVDRLAPEVLGHDAQDSEGPGEAAVGNPLVLIVDQFEELWTAGADHAERAAFIDEVLALLSDGAAARVVLVCRGDFVGRLAEHTALAERAAAGVVLVPPMTEAEVREVVEGPAAAAGLSVDPDLSEAVIRDVYGQSAVLPLLSSALTGAWEHRQRGRLTLSGYLEAGGVTGALAHTAEAAVASLGSDGPARARALLVRLATTDESGTVVRRRVPLDELDLDGPDGALRRETVEAFVARRLFAVDAAHLEVTHEALFTAWPRLAGWLADDAAGRAVRAHLSPEVRDWDDAGRPSDRLYRGARLAAAQEWLGRSNADSTGAERDFIEASAALSEADLVQARAGRRRARVVAASLAGLLALVASLGGFAIIQRQRAAASAALAQRSAAAADAGRLGTLARTGGDYDQALLLAAQAMKLKRSPAVESDLFATLIRGDAVRRVMRAPKALSTVEFLDGGSSVVAATFDGQVLRWPTGSQAAPSVVPGVDASAAIEGYGADVDPLQVTPDGMLIVLAERQLQLADPATGRILAQGPEVGRDVWSPVGDGRDVLAAAPGERDFGWNTASKDQVVLWRSDAPGRPRLIPIGATALRISPCGPATACVLGDHGLLIRVGLVGGVVLGQVAIPAADALADPPSMVATPDGRQVAVPYADGIVRLIDTRTGQVSAELGGASRSARVLAFSPDGRRLAASDFGTVLVWRMGKKETPEVFAAHAGQVRSASWATDGASLATAGEDGTVILWDTSGRERTGELLTDDLEGNASSIWPVDSKILVGQRSGDLAFVDPATGQVTRATGSPHRKPIDSVRASRSGQLVVTSDANGVAAVWDLRTAMLLGVIDLPAPVGPIASDLSVSPDGVTAATLRDATVGPLIVDLRTRKEVRRLPPIPGPAAAMGTTLNGWTADGRSLILFRWLSDTASEVLVMDAASGQITLRVPTGADWPFDVTDDPGGRFLVVGTYGGKVLVLDRQDGHLLAPPLTANDGIVVNVSVSPDGRYVSASGSPPRVAVWDTRTFQPIGTPIPLDVDAPSARARFSPDGRLIIATGTTVRTVSVDPEQWLKRACSIAGRTITREEWAEFLPGRTYSPACSMAGKPAGGSRS